MLTIEVPRGLLPHRAGFSYGLTVIPTASPYYSFVYLWTVSTSLMTRALTMTAQ